MLIRRPGFSLAEILFALAILALLAAATFPSVAAQLRRGQGAATASAMANIRDAVVAYRGNVTRYPRTLSQLTNALGVTATESCAGGLTAAQRNAWRGPYLSQFVSGNMAVGDGTVLDTLIRNPATNGAVAPGTLIVRVINVDSTTAAQMERQFDGGSPLNYTTGSVLWATTGLDTLKFQILIRDC